MINIYKNYNANWRWKNLCKNIIKILWRTNYTFLVIYRLIEKKKSQTTIKRITVLKSKDIEIQNTLKKKKLIINSKFKRMHRHSNRVLKIKIRTLLRIHKTYVNSPPYIWPSTAVPILFLCKTVFRFIPCARNNQ